MCGPKVTCTRLGTSGRAQVILMLAHGDSFSMITATVGCYRLHQPLETAVRTRAPQRPAREKQRAAGDDTDSAMEARDSVEDPAASARRQHPLEHAEAREVLALVTCCRPGLARAGLQPHRSNATCSPMIRPLSRKPPTSSAVSQSPATCRRICGRREDGHSSPGSVGSGAAALAGRAERHSSDFDASTTNLRLRATRRAV